MPKEAVFTMKLEPDLREAFMSEAQASHRPASQILRELMREFVQKQRQAREYDDFLAQKVQTARLLSLFTTYRPIGFRHIGARTFSAHIGQLIFGI